MSVFRKVEEGKFTGRVLQRELSMITNLMREENFVNVTRDDGQPLNVSKARIWFEVNKIRPCIQEKSSSLIFSRTIL